MFYDKSKRPRSLPHRKKGVIVWGKPSFSQKGNGFVESNSGKNDDRTNGTFDLRFFLLIVIKDVFLSLLSFLIRIPHGFNSSFMVLIIITKIPEERAWPFTLCFGPIAFIPFPCLLGPRIQSGIWAVGGYIEHRKWKLIPFLPRKRPRSSRRNQDIQVSTTEMASYRWYT